MGMFIKCVCNQIFRILFDRNNYPYVGIPLRYWSCYITLSSKTKYNHWKTLKNYISNVSVNNF